VQESDLKKIVWYDPSHYGFAVISDDTRGVILPNTAGVSTAKDALSMLKNKHDITGKAYIYVFETMRLSVL
jgi:thiazole synthase ThiGH ThiG subunit